MSIICIAKGTATIGLTTRGADGKIISQTPARWEHDPDGGCVALWTMNPETEEQEAPARIYGDWQASERPWPTVWTFACTARVLAVTSA